MTAISGALSGWFRRRNKQDDTDTNNDNDNVSDARNEQSEEIASPNVETEGASVSVTGGDGETEPVVVWDAPNRMEAEIVRGHLESQGIPAIITGDVAASIFGFHTGNLAKASVLVPAPLADRAIEILEAAIAAAEEAGDQDEEPVKDADEAQDEDSAAADDAPTSLPPEA